MFRRIFLSLAIVGAIAIAGASQAEAGHCYRSGGYHGGYRSSYHYGGPSYYRSSHYGHRSHYYGHHRHHGYYGHRVHHGGHGGVHFSIGF